jgi:Lhr-like helicase
MPTTLFHPAVNDWFTRHFASATPAQAEAWPAIKAGKHTLIAAPTGSGKTLAAFLSAIDDLVREGLERGLANETHVLYVSPLKALSNDIQKNLQEPLCGITDALNESGLPSVNIRALVRTGDTPPPQRGRMRREPPPILVTTPESLFILLTSDSGRQMLSTVRTVIVDEIHVLADNKRGTHLSLSLELGIDIGDVDLVCQVGSPRSIAAFLQRVGRSGHRVGALPKGRLFPLTRDDLVECAALLDAVRRDKLDRLKIPTGHIDVLSQQIIAEVAGREWQEERIRSSGQRWNSTLGCSIHHGGIMAQSAPKGPDTSSRNFAGPVQGIA